MEGTLAVVQGEEGGPANYAGVLRMHSRYICKATQRQASPAGCNSQLFHVPPVLRRKLCLLEAHWRMLL